ncbi:MAG: sterol desaturase family protein [Cyclobacteriaceae bacterium]
MDFNPVILSIPLYFFLIGLELLHQTITKKKTYRTNDAIANISCGITSQVTNAIWGVLSIGMYQYIYQYWSFATIETTLVSNLILFVLVDFFYYWFHRASHEINFLWNTAHVVHHQSEDYNLSVALRQTSFGGVFSMFFYLPLAFMGFSAVSFLMVKGLNLIYQFWIHTDAINKLPRWFEWIFNTPSHHRVHHGRNPKYIDRNHAGTLMLWDRMFGTFQEEEEKPTYGVTKPANTWNPVWANVLPIVEMTKQVTATPGFMNKLKVLFYKPGWQPDEFGGYQQAPEVDKSAYVKYDTHPQASLTRYIFIQFLMTLGFTSFFLFRQKSFDMNLKLIMAGFVVWSVVQLGLMLENRKWAIKAEYLRVIAGGCLIFYLLSTPLSIYLGIGSIVLFTFWLVKAARH